MPKITPTTTISITALLCAALVFLLVLIATQRPWLGLGFDVDATSAAVRVARVDAVVAAAYLPVGSVVVGVEGASGQRMALTAGDLEEEPDVAESYSALEDFFARQQALSRMLESGTVTLALQGEDRIAVSPLPRRPLGDLPVVFWVQVFVGVTSFLIGAWVWSLRPHEGSTAILAVIGCSILLFSFAAAVYTTRELALGGALFRSLYAINHLGASAFGVAMIVLFLRYPRSVAPQWFVALVPMVFAAWWLADTAHVGFTRPAEGAHLPILLLMLGIAAAAAMQYHKTRGDPAARAALRWFALSVTIGAGAFVLMVAAPKLLGQAPSISQGYGFLFFLLIYAGVALGVARYRLFELEGWAFRVLFYLAGIMLLILLDALLVFTLTVDRRPAFALSLIVVSLVYLPLRDWLWRRFSSASEPERRIFHRVIDVALTPPELDPRAAWQDLLIDAFDPLNIATGNPGNRPEIVEDGTALLLPGIGPLGPLRLEHAHGGRKLFNWRDLQLAEEVLAMLEHTFSSRGSYERGAAEERSRVARDMHDNIGAQLLTALHSEHPERKDTYIREAIADIRGIVNNVSRGGQSLGDALAELRLEASQRLALAGIELDWRENALEGAATASPQLVQALRSILREALSNAIRHSGATRVTVTPDSQQGQLFLTIADNGKGLAGDAMLTGNGLANMRNRVGGLKGTIELVDNAPGLRLDVKAPL